MGNDMSIPSQELCSHFEQDELKRLGKRFKKLDLDGSGSLSIAEFMTIPELQQNPLVQRVISIFDADNNGEVDFKEFIEGISQFSVKGDKEAKLKFAFKIYDIDRDGFITNSELFQVLKMMVGNNLKDPQLQQIVDKTIIYADKDKDGKISFEEFKSVIDESLKNNLENKMTVRVAEPGMSKAEAKAAADKAAAAAASASANKRFQQTQAQVDEVVDIMRLNVDKVLERDQKLSQLDDRADALQMGAAQFESSAGALKRKMWLKNLKMMILMGIVGTIFAGVVIFWIVSKVSPDSIPEPLQPFVDKPQPQYYPPPYPNMPPQQPVPSDAAPPAPVVTAPPAN